ncbi:MAG: hypothetical protein R2710_03595 [Acidimicrobiales bacterium]
MSVADAVDRFRAADFRWWLSGGHALEAHLGRRWRSHDDTDIGICRDSTPRLLEVLSGWDLHIGAGGVLTKWAGQPLDADRSQNNLWCRPTPHSPWMLDITIGDGDDQDWIYRRDRSIRRPWGDAVLSTPTGVAYLAPDLQLMFKSKDLRPKDDLDAATVIPALEPDRVAWLAEHLPAEHPWLSLVPPRDR